MVQLTATAAIEYVAACCRTRTKTKTVRGAYARSPQVQCVYIVDLGVYAFCA